MQHDAIYSSRGVIVDTLIKEGVKSAVEYAHNNSINSSLNIIISTLPGYYHKSTFVLLLVDTLFLTLC